MTVRRISVEIVSWREPTFDASTGAQERNVRAAQEWLEIEIEAACEHYRCEPHPLIRETLFTPPWSVRNFDLQQQFSAGDEPPGSPVAKDAGLVLFHVINGRPLDEPWEALTRVERREAKALGAQFFASNRIWRKGRPIETNVPLVLFLIFVIEEFIVKKKFPRSRPGPLAGKRSPTGPAFNLLRAAYAHASVSLNVTPSKPETVYRVVQVARSPAFRRGLEDLRSSLQSANLIDARLSFACLVAEHPARCELLFASTR
jgi:hypothetical protein